MSIHDRFPHGMTLKKFESTQIAVASHQFRLETLLTERYDRALNELLAVFEARRGFQRRSCDPEIPCPVRVPLYLFKSHLVN